MTRRNGSRRAAVLMLAAAGTFGLAAIEPAFAQSAGFTTLQTVLTNITSTIAGPIGRSLAVIGVMLVGLAWVFGQMDFRRAGAVIVGIAVIFGATEMVNSMTGG